MVMGFIFSYYYYDLRRGNTHTHLSIYLSIYLKLYSYTLESIIRGK